MPKSGAPQTERNHPREQTTGAAKEVMLTQRGIFDISITIFMKTLHVPFLLEKEKRGKSCFRDQTLTYKNNIHIHWKEVLQLRRSYRLQEMFL